MPYADDERRIIPEMRLMLVSVLVGLKARKPARANDIGGLLFDGHRMSRVMLVEASPVVAKTALPLMMTSAVHMAGLATCMWAADAPALHWQGRKLQHDEH